LSLFQAVSSTVFEQQVLRYDVYKAQVFIVQYKASDGEVGEPAFQKVCKHSWYLTEKNVLFALLSCSAAVGNETKQKIADQLCSMPYPD